MLSIVNALQDGKQVYAVVDGRTVISTHDTAAEADRARARLIKASKKTAKGLA